MRKDVVLARASAWALSCSHIGLDTYLFSQLYSNIRAGLPRSMRRWCRMSHVHEHVVLPIVVYVASRFPSRNEAEVKKAFLWKHQ